MKELFLAANLVFTAYMCSGEQLIPEQVNNDKGITKQEIPKQNPTLEASLVFSTEPSTAPVANLTTVIINNSHDSTEEKERNLKDTFFSSSNTRHTVEEDLKSGPFDEQDVTLLNAVSAKVLIAQDDSIDIVDLSTTMRRPRFLEKEGLTVYSVDFHWNKSLVFFAANNSIYRVDYHSKQDVSSLKPIVSERVDGSVRLAVDWIHDKLYWVCDKYQSIEMTDLDGKNRRLLADNIKFFKFPNNIVVDPFEKLLFFVSNFTIFKADLDGSKIRYLGIDKNNPGEEGLGIKNIALDRVNKKIVTTGKMKYLEGVFIAIIDYYGCFDKRNILTNPKSWTDVYSLEVFHDTLYFTHFSPGDVDKMYELSLPPTNDAAPKLKFVPRSFKNGIWSIRLAHPCVQLLNSDGQCS